MEYGYNDYIYTLEEDWVKLPQGESLVDIVGLSIDEKDNVYAFGRSKKPLIIFDKDGSIVDSWGTGLFKRPHGSFMTREGNIWLADDASHAVFLFTREGKLLKTIGKVGEKSDTGHHDGLDVFEKLSYIKQAAGPFNLPTGVAVASSGDIFVSDGYGNARVHRFSPEGELILSWGSPGAARGEFRLPHNIWIDSKDRIWIPDRENHRVQIFDVEGNFLDEWIDLWRPTHVYMDKEETVYISELSRRISIFTIDGELLSRWGNEDHSLEDPLFVGPHVLCVDSRGDLYVGEVAQTFGKVDRGARALQKFKRK